MSVYLFLISHKTRPRSLSNNFGIQLRFWDKYINHCNGIGAKNLLCSWWECCIGILVLEVTSHQCLRRYAGLEVWIRSSISIWYILQVRLPLVLRGISSDTMHRSVLFGNERFKPRNGQSPIFQTLLLTHLTITSCQDS